MTNELLFSAHEVRNNPSEVDLKRAVVIETLTLTPQPVASPAPACGRGGKTIRLRLTVMGRAQQWPESGSQPLEAVPRSAGQGAGKSTARCSCFVN